MVFTQLIPNGILSVPRTVYILIEDRISLFFYSARPFYAANILDILLLNYGN